LWAVAPAADGGGLQKISDHVYSYAGANGVSSKTGFVANVGLVVGRDSALVVDTLLSPKLAFDKEAKVLCEGKTAADAPAIAGEFANRLPEQNRTELPGMIETNLRIRYLPQPAAGNSEAVKTTK
jgi:hypothetical protein